MPLPWYVEDWHVIPSIAAILGTIVLSFAYVRWLRKTGVSEPQKLVKHLATFYKLLAVVSLVPVISPSYWGGFNILYIIGPFFNASLSGLAGIAMMVVFWFLFSYILAFLCIETATGLPQGQRRVLSLVISMLFATSGVFALKSLYPDLLWALGDPHHSWICILLYILANLSITIMNLVSVYYVTIISFQFTAESQKSIK